MKPNFISTGVFGANGLYLVFLLAETGLDIGVAALGGEYLFLGADKRSIRDVVFGLCVLTDAVPTLFLDGGLGLGGDFFLGVADLFPGVADLFPCHSSFRW